MFFGFDIYYFILVVPAFLFALYAQFKVTGTFGKYSKYRSFSGMTGAEVAKQILYSNGLYQVRVEPVAGQLTDHYDPRTRTVRLSESVYHSDSVAAIGVAAHETGHAIQHAVGYAPLALRSSLVPAAGIGSAAGPILAIVGLIFNWPLFLQIGIVLYTVAVAFYLVTLPVEFNASSRAVAAVTNLGIVNWQEASRVEKVLKAAAMTYVASAAVAIASLLRLVLLSGMGGNDE